LADYFNFAVKVPKSSAKLFKNVAKNPTLGC
jgi:hypothetical protein